ncbi:MAG: hypothetical protein P4L99_18245 [Chthoniobacter sp.]|nr:hypothetical protein [Chthoniobacter sp.]
MKRFALLSLVLGTILLVPTGAFAHDKDKHHKHHRHHHDWSDRGYRGDYRDYRDYRDSRDYQDNQAQIEADRVANGYYPDGTPRNQYRRYYGR